MRRLMDDMSELGTPKSKRTKQLAAGKYDAAYFAAQKLAIQEEMASELRAREEAAEAALKHAIIDGSLRVRDIAESIDLVALAASMGGGKSAKRLLAGLSLPAVERIRTALMSMDERTSLAAAKIVVDADDAPPPPKQKGEDDATERDSHLQPTDKWLASLLPPAAESAP